MPNPRRPTTMKVLAGTYRRDRANEAEPQAPALSVGTRPPTWVKSSQAKRAWAALIEVAPDGLITQMDTLSLGLLVSAFGDWLAARTVIGQEGRYYETAGPSGRMVRAHPAVTDEADAWKRAAAMLAKFGMTPSDRSRVSAGQPDSADPVGDFLGSRGVG